MLMPITTMVALLLCPLFIKLSFQVIAHRRKIQVGVGDGADKQLTRYMRVHSNFAEYVPLNLCLFFLAEIQHVHYLFLCGCATLFVSGRYIHAYGVSQMRENLTYRVRGMQATFFTMIFLCVALGLTMIQEYVFS